MKKIKLKKNKVILILAVCLAIILIFCVKILFDYSNDNEAIYGNRLDGINKVQVTNKEKDTIVNNLKTTDKVKKSTVSIQGKIINVTISLKDDTSRDDAKALADKVLEKLSDKEKKFYDVQIFISKTTDDAQFPIIGYRHHTKDSFTWTLDR